MQEHEFCLKFTGLPAVQFFAFAVSANVAAQTLSESLSPTTNGLSKPVEALTVHEIVTALAPAKSIDLTERKTISGIGCVTVLQCPISMMTSAFHTSGGI